MTFIVVLVGILSFAPPLDTDCSVATLRHNPEGYVWPLSAVQGFARGALLIVRVRADSLDDGFEDQHILTGGPPSSVHFTVLETIRGDSLSSHLRFAGVFAEGDDFNPAPVPYQIVRPSGLRGNCYALEYRQDAEYLLMLREVSGVLSPYWAPLAPLNEQVRGADDPWVAWIRSALH